MAKTPAAKKGNVEAALTIADMISHAERAAALKEQQAIIRTALGDSYATWLKQESARKRKKRDGF